MSQPMKIAIMILLTMVPSVCLVGQSMKLPSPQKQFVSGAEAANFTLKDQDGRDVTLAKLRGNPVLLVFYRGYWWPYCLSELREFAQHKAGFDKLHTRILAISVDDLEHAKMVWERAAGQQFDILSDPGAEVIRSYGLLHLSGHRGNDIAIRTAVLIDKDGRERWRRVSDTITDVPGSEEVLEQIRKLASK